jgi:hypothetical protein
MLGWVGAVRAITRDGGLQFAALGNNVGLQASMMPP